MKKNVLTALLLFTALLSTLSALSQNKTIKGKVTDEAGIPIPGASVSVNGTKSGTITQADGSFEVSAPEKSSVSVSIVGYGAAELPVVGKDFLEFRLVKSTTQLNEVVVTALGIRREKRNLTFSSQELKADELVRAKDPFLINAMAGKVAGVQITNASGTPGSSSRILVRGVTSFFGNNEALIVLDGIPIDNSETGGVNSGPGSNRLIDIDPSTVESMNVLKGAAATALYGSAGARGVIIITTKSGANNKRPLITVSSDLGFDKPIFPEVQSKYSQGENGQYYDGTTLKTSSSYGALMDTLRVGGQPVRKFNQLERFFRTGKSTNNSISVAGGGPSSNYFASYSYFNQDGTVPRSNFIRHSLFSKFTTKLSDKFTATLQFTYANSHRRFMPEGYILEAPVWTIYNAPISYDMKPYLNPDGTQRLFRFSRNNPYWVLDNIFNTSDVNRFVPVATLSYNPTSWLTFTERFGADIYTEQVKYFENLGSVANINGVIVDRTSIFRQFNHDFIINARKEFGNFNVDLVLGNNILSKYGQSMQARGVGLSNPGFTNMSNAATQTYTESHSLARKVGFYSQATVDYKRLLALALTGRYDGSSVLAKGNNWYPYGSAAMSFIFSELLPASSTSFLNFAKLRVSYATVGNDNVAPYSLNTPFGVASVNGITFPFSNQNGFLLSSTLGNANLENELSKEFEVGLESRLLKNRVSLELSYFNKKVENGIIPGVSIAPSSGFTGTTVNSAELRTKGLELLINGSPVKTTRFTWDVTFTFTKLDNKILTIYQDQVQLTNGFTLIKVGEPYGSLFGSTYKRDDKTGALLIDNNGLPIIGPVGVTGNITPDWLAGITNSFRYKQLFFSFFFDMKKGGDLQNNVDSYGLFYGMPKITEDRAPRVVEGIVESTGLPNAKTVTGIDYWRRVSSIYEATTQDATFIKLRNVSLSYDFGSGIVSKTPFKSISLGVTGRNLWIHKPHFTGSDPEVSSFGSRNGDQGMYSFSTPTNRSVNFNLKFTF
jgi:TonB-linked SusC/RagA family outer membrane protein